MMLASWPWLKKQSAPSSPRFRQYQPSFELLGDRRLLSAILFSSTLGAHEVSEIAAGPDGNLWFAESNFDGSHLIGRITPAGDLHHFPLPDSPQAGYTVGVTAGPDGNVWYTTTGNFLGRITPAGEAVEFPVQTSRYEQLGDITTGPDGSLWFSTAFKIGRATPDGQVTLFEVARPSRILGLAAGPDGAIWFTQDAGVVGRITPDGVATEFSLPPSTPGADGLGEITTGPDGNLWYARDGMVGRLTPDGNAVEFPLPAGHRFASSITRGPDGNLWFTETVPHEALTQAHGNTIVGRITPQGQIAEYIIPFAQDFLGDITSGPDGRIWFVAFIAGRNDIGRLDVDAPEAQALLNATPQAPDFGTVIAQPLGASVTVTTGPIASPQATFVRQLYHDWLAREPEEAGLRFWVGRLDSGASRADVVRGFQTSSEYRTKGVEELYRTLLGRTADPSGMATWTGWLDRGGSWDQVRTGILGSLEYFTRRGQGTLVGFLASLYRDTLGRDADATELQAWTGVVVLGVSRIGVAQAFLTSPEARRKAVADAYQQVLHRGPDEIGSLYWEQFLAIGNSAADLIANLFTSDEYFEHTTSTPGHTLVT